MATPSDSRQPNGRRPGTRALQRANTATAWLLSTPWAFCLLLLAAAVTPQSYHFHTPENIRLLLLGCALLIAGAQLVASLREGRAALRAKEQAKRGQR
jgi:hypothetical protein